LRCNIGTGRDDLELLDILLDARLRGEGLLRSSPSGCAQVFADEAVDEGDLVGTGLLDIDPSVASCRDVYSSMSKTDGKSNAGARGRSSRAVKQRNQAGHNFVKGWPFK